MGRSKVAHTSPNIKILISFFAHSRPDSHDTEFPIVDVRPSQVAEPYGEFVEGVSA